MAYVTALYAGGDAQVDYRLGIIPHGCVTEHEFGYRTDMRERPLRWIGEGLSAFEGFAPRAGDELTEAHHDAARALLAGCHPATGEQLVVPHRSIAPEAKVALKPFVEAVRARALQRAVEPVDMFSSKTDRDAWAAAVRAVDKRGAAALMAVNVAEKLASNAGFAPTTVWSEKVLRAANGALFEDQAVLDGHGQPVLDADGQPRTRRVERRVVDGIVGFDIEMDVPKSLSLLLAFAPDDLVGRVESTYVDAMNRTFSWTEARTSYVQRGRHGDGKTARREASSGMAGWVMTHRTARPVDDAQVGDPHFHLHMTVANMAQAADGKWLTIASGGRALMTHAVAIGKVSQAQIRADLHRDFGITFARSATSRSWEVEHVPQDAIDLFSKRRDQVRGALAALGYDNADVSAQWARTLTSDTRSAKTETTGASDATLRELWTAQAAAADLHPDTYMPTVLARYAAGHTGAGETANTAMLARHGITLDDLLNTLTHPESGLTAHQRRFTALDAIVAVSEALPLGGSIDDVERLVDVVLSHPAVVALVDQVALQAEAAAALRNGEARRVSGQLPGAHRMTGGALYTTRDVPEAEQFILDAIANSRHEQARGVVAEATIDLSVDVVEAAQGYDLSAEQRGVLHQVLRSGRAVEAIEGPPGTGKTTLMRAARVAWEAQGYVVAGAATAAVAAQNLAAESGISSRTVAQWMARIARGNGLSGVHVLVLDEANLTDDRARAALYAEAQATGTKIVEVGDPRQLRGVGVGSLFGYLHASLDGPRLTENRRQRHEDERAALAAFRDGRHAEALRTWSQTGGLVATETAEHAVVGMVATWISARQGAPDPHTQADGLLMLAATNAQVRRINDTVQAVRLAEGELGDGRTFATTAGRVEFHVGDQILLRRNDRYGDLADGAPVLNGYRGVVLGIDDRGVEVAWRQPGAGDQADPLTTICSPAYIADGGLELGYALTAHKAEGLTVGAEWDRPDGTRNGGTVLVYGPGMDNPGLYVSMSRDRGKAMVFGSLEELEGERDRLVSGVPRSQEELTDRVAGALAQRARATAESPNDVPVLVDLGRAPLDPADTRTPAGLWPVVDIDQDTGRDQRRTPSPSAAADRVAAGADETGDPQGRPAPADRLDVSPEAVAERMRRWHREFDRTDDEVRVADAVEQWRTLRGERLHASARHDLDAVAAVDQRLREFEEGLAPEIRDALAARQEASRQRREARTAARTEARAQERAEVEAEVAQRPHGLLTDRELDRALQTAITDRDRQASRREKLVEQVAALEVGLREGTGPAVTSVDDNLREARQVQEAAAAVDAASARQQQLHATIRDAARQEFLLRRKLEPGGIPRYRRGLRTETEQKVNEEVERRVTAEHELPVVVRAAEMAREDLRGWQLGDARTYADRQEATYGRRHLDARRADEQTLDTSRTRVVRQEQVVEQGGQLVDQLQGEVELRVGMPSERRVVESGAQLRHSTQVTTDRARSLARSVEAERQRQASVQGERDYSRRVDRGGPSISGPSL